uniref:Erythropoietin receptor n=1 Tax=Nothobranchius rachovii TaxID=451742 RepID=A0A1A8NW76_9TELE
MTRDQHSRLVAVYLVCCVMGTVSTAQRAQDFQRKASMLLAAEPENPKCFAEGRKAFTCFWEEDEERAGSVEQYSFTYAYQNENGSRCPLTVAPAAGGKKLFVCHLDRIQMFVQLDIQVHRERVLIHNRSLLIELVFLLDPPENVTVSSTGHQGQLNVSWVPPPLKYMDDSMIYEVMYAKEGDPAGQVEVARACSELILRGLQSATKYRVEVRVRLDGITYNGYWSAWSDPACNASTQHDERELSNRSDSAQTDEWRATQQEHWLMERLRETQQNPRMGSSLLESQDTYVTLSTNNHSEEDHIDDALEEALPLEMHVASRKTPLSELHSDLGSGQQSLGSGRLSSQSSFEYPNQGWIPKGPGYAYMAVADSGVSMDYSPMSRVDDLGKVALYANEYKNEIPPHRRPFLIRQYHVHDDG